MPVASLDNRSGYVLDTDPKVLLEAETTGRMMWRHLTLYATASTAFVLRYVLVDQDGQETQVVRFVDTIPANDCWEWGAYGGIMILPLNSRLELVLDSTPTNPVHYSLDYGRASS